VGNTIGVVEETGPALCPCFGRRVLVTGIKVREATIVGVMDTMVVGEAKLLSARVLEGKIVGVIKC